MNSRAEITSRQYDVYGDVTFLVRYADLVDMDGSFTGSKSDVDAWVEAMPSTTNRDDAMTYSYDTRGHVTQMSGDDVHVTNSYNRFGEISHVEDRSIYGHRLDTYYDYDASGHLSRKDQFEISGSIMGSGGFGAPLEAHSSWTYDAFGEAATYTDADGSVTAYRYDALGNAAGNSETVSGVVRDHSATYDAFGRVISQTDALGLTTTFDYDDATRTVTTHLPGGAQTVSMHNRFGQVVSFTDATGASTLYGYDGAGRLRSTTRPDGAATSGTYDVLGNLTSSTDAAGIVVTYTYDAAGHVLTQTVDPDGLALVTTYTYDGVGRQITVTDPSGNVRTNAYDGGGNVTHTELRDALGNVVSTADNYWTGNHLSESDTTSSTGDKATLRYDYDGYGRLIKSDAASYGVTHYAYDSNGNLILTSSDAGYGKGAFTYFFYNEAGELIYKVQPATGFEYGEPAQTDAVTGYTYDAAGNVVSTTQYAVTLDDSDLSSLPDRNYGSSQSVSTLDQLHAVLGELVASVDDRTSYQVYDSLGRLAYQVDPLGNVVETRYDGAGRVVAVLDHANPVAIDAATAARLALGTESASAFASLLVVSSDIEASAHGQYTYYDVMGRVAFVVATGVVAGVRQGRVTETRYDADGRVVATVVHDDWLDDSAIGGLDTDVLLAWAGSHQGGLTQWTAYDGVGRPIWQIAPMAASATMCMTPMAMWLRPLFTHTASPRWATAARRRLRRRWRRRIPGLTMSVRPARCLTHGATYCRCTSRVIRSHRRRTPTMRRIRWRHTPMRWGTPGSISTGTGSW